MAMQIHFYVTLFSNASRDIYEQNTHADFTVKVAQPVGLSSISNWEVGVCEISCSSTPPIDDGPALIYCNLISPQFEATAPTAACRHSSFHHHHVSTIFETCIMCLSSRGDFRTFESSS